MPIRNAISDLRAKDAHNYPASNVQPLDYMPIGYAIFNLRAKYVHNYPACNVQTEDAFFRKKSLQQQPLLKEVVVELFTNRGTGAKSFG